MLQRDAFISVIHQAAKQDKDIYLLSADFGAQSLDAFRNELPNQFLHCGISEQHMIDMAAGLALAGKKVYCYCMGPFMLRAYEQIKCLAMMNLPVTLISTGVGLGYADSGPTHYVTEDIACFRAINGIEIMTPADSRMAAMIAESTVNHASFRYIRLDREELPDVQTSIDNIWFQELAAGGRICILSSGYMLHRAFEAHKKLYAAGIETGLIDLWRIKPMPENLFALERYDGIVTVEEQCLSGGFGSAIIEYLADVGTVKTVRRLGLPDRYFYENGGRAKLLDHFGLSVDHICEAVLNMRA